MIGDRSVNTRSQFSYSMHKRWNKLTTEDLARARVNVQQLIDVLQERYGYTKARAEKEARAFWDSHKDEINEMYETARRLPSDVDHQVRLHPWTSIVVGVGIGLLAGQLFKPRCDDDAEPHNYRHNHVHNHEHQHEHLHEHGQTVQHNGQHNGQSAPAYGGEQDYGEH